MKAAELTRPRRHVSGPGPRPLPRTDPRVRLASVLGSAVGGLVTVLVGFNLATDAGRTALAVGFGSGFFEIQADALIDGHLDIPRGSLGIEGFNMDDGTYTYFGPFPALVRIPVMLVTHDFDGQLTLVSMLAAWLVFAVMATRLTWLVRACLRGAEPVGRLDAVVAAVVVAAVTGGTTLTYDVALPYAYHEVYLWQTAFVVGAAYWMLRVVTATTGSAPPWSALGWLTAMAAGAALTRATGGWSVCLAVMALAAFLRWGRSTADRRDWARWVLLAGLVPLAIASAVNIMKFGNPLLFPLENQEFTSLSAQRREALRVNGGSITGLQFFQTSFVNYFDPGGIRTVSWFPWITLPPHNAPAYGGAYLDQSYRTGSITAFMPMLVVMALVSVGVLVRRTRLRPDPAAATALRFVAVGALLMTGGVMNYGYLSHRYTSEFVPALVVGAIICTWGVLVPLVRRVPRLTVPVVGVLALGAIWSLWANTAIGLSAAAENYGGAPLDRLVGIQDATGGGPGSAFADRIHVVDALPGDTDGDTDDLYVVGDCDGLYLNSGDDNAPWTIVEERSRVVDVRLPEAVPESEIELMTIYGFVVQRVFLRTDPSGLMWFEVEVNGSRVAGEWFMPAPDQVVRLGIQTDSATGFAEVTSSPGGFVGYVPMTHTGGDEVRRVNKTELIESQVVDGIELQVRPGLTPSLCQQLIDHNDITLP